MLSFCTIHLLNSQNKENISANRVSTQTQICKRPVGKFASCNLVPQNHSTCKFVCPHKRANLQVVALNLQVVLLDG